MEPKVDFLSTLHLDMTFFNILYTRSNFYKRYNLKPTSINFINSTTPWRKKKKQLKLTSRYVAMATSSKTNFSGSVTSGQTYTQACFKTANSFTVVD